MSGIEPSSDTRGPLHTALKSVLPARMQRRDETSAIYPGYVLGVLFLVYVVNFIDRQIISILAPEIKGSLGVSDVQLGFLYGTSFAILYSVFGIPLARLADRWYRARLIAIGLAVWSIMTTLSGFASVYGHLVFTRIGVGIGEASATPAVYSLLSDYFPLRRRALAIGIYTSGVSVGQGLSLALGGWISHTWSRSFAAGAAPFDLLGWQAAFVGVGVPGLVLAVWVLTLREPVRGSSDGQDLPVVTRGTWRAFTEELAAILPPITFWSAARFPGALSRNLLLFGVVTIGTVLLVWISSDWAEWIGLGLGIYAVGSWLQTLYATDRPTFALLLGTRSAVLALFGLGTIAFISYSLTFWVPSYVIRTFGVRADVAGFALGVPSVFAAAFGVIAGGYFSDIWKRRDPRGRLFLCMLSVVLSVPPIVALLTAKNDTIIYTAYPLTQLAINSSGASGITAIQDYVLPRMRATAGAIYLLAYSMLGLALGPYSIGKLSAVTGSLRMGMLGVLAVVPIAFLLLGLAARGVKAAEISRLTRARAAGESC